MDINTAGGSDAGISDEKIDALVDYETSEHYSPAEKAALRLADVMSEVHVDVPDALYAELRGHYDDAALVELGAIIATEHFRSRLNRLFQVEAQGFYCRLPAPGE